MEFSSINAAVSALFGSEVESSERLYGGDINNAFALRLKNGGLAFMKSNRSAPPGFFKAEIEGLSAIAKTETIGTPRALGYGSENGRAFLILEYVSEGRRTKSFWETFGRRLAAMHAADTSPYVHSGRFGFDLGNYIGRTRQINSPKDTWIDFFRECRLEPQFKAAERFFGASDIKRINSLLDDLGNYLTEPRRPSLLHGDLWSGNFMTGPDGEAWLIDPAVYVGHAEADIAMTELFGGFDSRFYAAYREAAPLEPGYPDRRDLYNLYQLLNHLNIFGGSYLGSVMRIVKRYA